MPTASDLVTDLPADFETFGQAVATSMADLLGGTTGQVLSKASNTDMDFTWVAQDDSNAIQNAIVDAKGDLIGATAADTPARLAVGTNGQVLTADSTAATGLAWATPSGGTNLFYAGKNKIINGDFSINQRNFTSNTTNATFNFDRYMQINTGTGATLTITPQVFTPGTAPVAGYEGTNYVRGVTTNGSDAGTYAILMQKIENVRTLAGQTATISFWAKAATGTPKLSVELQQGFGTGGSTAVETAAASAFTLSTSWARYSTTINVPSVSGKTIGTGSSLSVYIWMSAGSTFNSRANSIGLQSNTFDIWGVQVEAGSTATDFQTATGTIQGELAACQRYYQLIASGTNKPICPMSYPSAANVFGTLAFPEMRTAPTLVIASGTDYYNVIAATGASDYLNAFTITYSSTRGILINNNSEASNTAGFAGQLVTNNASSSVALNSEL